MQMVLYTDIMDTLGVHAVLILMTTITCTISDELYCLSCTSVVDPRHCHTIRRCNEGQVCYTERYTGANRETLYDTGCHTPSYCKSAPNIDRIYKSVHLHTEQCVECCTGHLCNNKSCGTQGFPQQRGPICFNCQQSLDPQFCSTIKVCNDDEVCLIRQEIEFGDVYYTSRCSQTHMCDTQPGNGIVFGKRTVPGCSSCCTADLCNNKCSVNGGWSSWGSFAQCSASCGNGTKSRTRTCTNPSPGHNGADCTGVSVQSKNCFKTVCPVNGGWSFWGSFGQCSVSCGNGKKSRTRTCTNPAPAYNGADCSGVSVESQTCYNTACPVNGQWSSWGSFGQCSVSCGNGTKSRTRTCTNPAPAHNGVDCSGDSAQLENCFKTVCTVSCLDILNNSTVNMVRSGVYTVYIVGTPKKVWCDMDTDGGGWTVIQRRQDGTTDFYRTWDEYKIGFGSASDEYWIGNDALHYLTTERNVTLRVDLEQFSGKKGYATYSTFVVANETSKYKLLISGYSGTANDCLAYNNGYYFTTKDRDNDNYHINCAEYRHSGWWHDGCTLANLNGQYNTIDRKDGEHNIYCFQWTSPTKTALRKTQMMIR